jgi:DNA-binding NarL/FixJ family response regulator
MQRPIRVLVVDDQPAARQGLSALLELVPDIEVVGQAANGQEALQLVAEKQPDVVLMDIQMPLLDGLETTRQIKHQGLQVRVIVLTVLATHRVEALAAGADAFLLKGGAMETLQATILGATASHASR